MPDGGRRLDWALLLPASLTLPLPDVVVLGGTEAMAEALVDDGLARRWRRPAAPGERCGFVVAWSDAEEGTDAIVEMVAPDGIVYLEVDRRRRRGWMRALRRTRRLFERRGCRVASAHLVTPDFDAARRYLPMDDRRAIRWHLRTLFMAPTPMTRAVQVVASAALATPAASAVVSIMARRYVVVGVASHEQPSPIGVPGGQGDERRHPRHERLRPRQPRRTAALRSRRANTASCRQGGQQRADGRRHTARARTADGLARVPAGSDRAGVATTARAARGRRANRSRAELCRRPQPQHARRVLGTITRRQGHRPRLGRRLARRVRCGDQRGDRRCRARLDAHLPGGDRRDRPSTIGGRAARRRRAGWPNRRASTSTRSTSTTTPGRGTSISRPRRRR